MKPDAQDIEITPHWFVGKGEVELGDLYKRPGRFIPVDGNLHPFMREGNIVYMSLESAHTNRIIGCFHYQWLRLLNYLKRFDL